MRLINDSPRVEGNNIMVDVDTDHPVQCGIRLASMASFLKDCESMQSSLRCLCLFMLVGERKLACINQPLKPIVYFCLHHTAH